MKRYMHPSVHSHTIYNSQDMETACAHKQTIGLRRCGMYIYTMEYYSAIKKNEILSFAATWMNLENIMLSEISQTKINTV